MVRTTQIGGKQVIVGRNGALVASQSEPGSWHVVRDGRCDCKGFAYLGTCSHVAALTAEQARKQAVLKEVREWFEDAVA